MVLYGHVIDGVYIGDKINLKSFEGKKIKIEIKENRSTRSQMQNSYYWGVVLKYLVDETGHTAEELHEIFKTMFLDTKPVIFQGVAYNLAESTTTLNTLEMMQYLDKIRDFASKEFNCYIPEPNEELK
jgi:hypothetical protein